MLTYTVIRETWLTRKPSPMGVVIAVGATLALFFGSWIFWADLGGAMDKMPVSHAEIFQGHEYYRLWTALFAHADLAHLFSNSILFFILGLSLSGYFGLGVFPAAAFVWGGLINLFSVWTYPPDVHLLGASGVVFWMGGAWLTLSFLLDRTRTQGARLLRSAGVSLALFMPAETFDPAISYRTHLIGFLLGVAWAGSYFIRHKKMLRQAERSEIVVEDSGIESTVIGWS